MLSTAGKRLTSAAPRIKMQAVWNASGAGGSDGPTLLQKTAVTTIHSSFPEIKKALAHKMEHLEARANCCFVLCSG